MARQLHATGAEERRVVVAGDQGVLEGNLMVPANARGVVLAADSSGECPHRPSNVALAEVFKRAGLATFVLGRLADTSHTR